MKVSAIAVALFFALGPTLAVAQGAGGAGGAVRALGRVGPGAQVTQVPAPLAEGARPQRLAKPAGLPTCARQIKIKG
jgi:hypothetical protein